MYKTGSLVESADQLEVGKLYYLIYDLDQLPWRPSIIEIHDADEAILNEDPDQWWESHLAGTPEGDHPLILIKSKEEIKRGGRIEDHYITYVNARFVQETGSCDVDDEVDELKDAYWSDLEETLFHSNKIIPVQ